MKKEFKQYLINQNLSANDISLLNDFADNKISMEDAMQSIKQFYKI